MKISKEHGLNPSLMQCFLWGKEKGIALLGHIKDAKEALHKAVFDYEPCDECKAFMKKGIIVIETADDDQNYRLGGFAVIADRFFEENVNDEKLLQNILEKRICMMQTTIYQQLIKKKKMNKLFYEDCKHRYYQRGFKQPRDNGMPERSWGCYLPGDEPGWMCDITGDSCHEDDCPLNEEE